MKHIAAEATKGIEAYDRGNRTQALISLEAILLWTEIDAPECEPVPAVGFYRMCKGRLVEIPDEWVGPDED